MEYGEADWLIVVIVESEQGVCFGREEGFMITVFLRTGRDVFEYNECSAQRSRARLPFPYLSTYVNLDTGRRNPVDGKLASNLSVFLRSSQFALAFASTLVIEHAETIITT